ncbi:MAG: endolytic transglycosylase MltG [Clostridia bacterium]|nr:endolytic transglycosylase MltG [Clostridia bacterium]
MARRKNPPRDYDYQMLHEERSYGFFWYDWIWRVLRPVLILTCSVLLVGGLVGAAWGWAQDNFVAPIDANDTTPQLFEISRGSSLTRVANELEAANLVRNGTVFKYVADFMGMGQKIQPGEYTLTRAMSLHEMIAMLSEGDGKPLTARITVIPGWTIEDIATRFAADGVIKDKDDFLQRCKSGALYTDFLFVADVLGTPTVNQRRFVLEGYLSPNTYEIFTNATIDEIIRKLLAQTDAAFPISYQDRAEELGMSMDQVLTLASLIEKEAKKTDFARVSAVFHNRLKDNMALGADVTIKYALGSNRMALTEGEISVSSAFNTYQHRGLPPGPICSPSGDAILAALYPDEQFIAQKYLYFCSTEPDSGGLAFARTLREHEANVAQYRPLWIAYDESRGL